MKDNLFLTYNLRLSQHVGGVISFLRRKELAIFDVGVLERTKV